MARSGPPTPSRMDARETYLARVQSIVRGASTFVSQGGIERVGHLVDHGEPGEAMLSLAWIIVNEKCEVPSSLIASIRETSAGLIPQELLPANLDEFAVR